MTLSLWLLGGGGQGGFAALSSPHLQLTVVIPNGEQRNEESHMFELSETGFSIYFWFTWFKNITNIQ
jgi:hypothetical protein